MIHINNKELLRIRMFRKTVKKETEKYLKSLIENNGK